MARSYSSRGGCREGNAKLVDFDFDGNGRSRRIALKPGLGAKLTGIVSSRLVSTALSTGFV